MIYLVSSKNSALLKKALEPEKNTWVKILPQILKSSELEPNDQVYIDISGLSAAEIKKTLGLLGKKDIFAGIIDPKGTAVDPASFFFMGGCDYIGPALLKKGLDKKRFLSALSKGAAKAKNTNDPKEKKKTHKMPAVKWEGWKSIRTGTTGTFFFLYISLSGKTGLKSAVGEKNFHTVKSKLRDLLQHNLRESDALLWMETEDSCLFLVPPRAANIKAAVESAHKLILNSRLISIEKLDLAAEADFTCALHYGKSIYQTPGKTGSIISESVNYIFHLGTKKAEPGRFTISGDVPEEAIPKGLEDLFLPAGIFEKIPIRHSRRFIYD